MEKLITKEIRDIDRIIGKTLTNNNKLKGNLNHTQLQILFYLLRHSDQEVCQKDLEIETHLKKASITGTLDSLQDKGIIERKQSEDDKRKNMIVLSKKALEEKENFETKIRQIEEEIKTNISKDELNDFFKVIDKIKMNLKK